ncbi:MAG TPA: hypothetical protein VIH50_02530 [Steroidobacteraceae bacterium]
MFDYFGVLISVIMGLALIHLLRGAVRLIQMRHEVRPYWVHIVWTINCAFYVLGIWWGMFWWRDLQDWTVGWFYFIATYAIALFLWAAMLYPVEYSRGFDFEEFFFDNRRWFFGIQTLVSLMDIPETLQKAALHLRPVPAQYVILAPTMVALSLTGLLTRNRHVHAVLCVAWFTLLVGYLFLTPIARIFKG